MVGQGPPGYDSVASITISNALRWAPLRVKARNIENRLAVQ